jgi:hypothetical protein
VSGLGFLMFAGPGPGLGCGLGAGPRSTAASPAAPAATAAARRGTGRRLATLDDRRGLDPLDLTGLTIEIDLRLLVPG